MKIIITLEYHQKRLDTALAALSSYSRHHIALLIKNECVSNQQNLTITKPAFLVETDQEFTLDLEKYKTLFKNEPFADITLDIKYEDEDIIVINKLAGHITHPAPGHAHNTLSQAVQLHCKESIKTFSQTPGIVHRLDKDTSGLIIFAKTDQAHNALQAQFAQRKILKMYIAYIHSTYALPDHFFLQAKVGPHNSEHQLMKAYDQQILLDYPVHKAFDFNIYQPSFTKIIPTTDTCPIVENNFKKELYKEAILECTPYNKHIVLCYPHTGRQHQIRVQLRAAGLSIYGDPLYSRYYAPRLLLHAAYVKFLHPTKSHYIEIFTQHNF